jgi:methylmalonyl-CoA mutase cobalamin-binding subunit
MIRESPANATEVARWTERLLTLAPAALHEALLAEHRALGGWWKVADLIGSAVTELGDRWERGESSVMEVRLAAERLARRVARLAEARLSPLPAPVALLAATEGDQHTLGLALAEMVLREMGYDVGCIGHAVPGEYLAAYVRDQPVTLIGLSASAASSDSQALRAIALPVAVACEEMGARLILGGRGSWPEDLPASIRVHSFAELYIALKA